jgi:hypothetical protein
MDREIHQAWRFARGQHLWLHTYQWTNHLIHGSIPGQWEINPGRIPATKRTGVSLSEQRVIDALSAPDPLVAQLDPTQFALILRLIPFCRSSAPKPTCSCTNWASSAMTWPTRAHRDGCTVCPRKPPDVVKTSTANCSSLAHLMVAGEQP